MEGVNQILTNFYSNVAISIIKILFLFLLFWIIWFLIKAIPYRCSTYYKSTHKPFISMFFNTGAYGEYLTYKCLRKYEEKGAKFLFNCYVPKDNEETSEIDVMMIYRSGIYVFESKNYSGWIFGSESGKMWTQTLPNGRTSRKEKFYNPIMQNKTHIKWLKMRVKETDPLHSIVVFSQRCELKKLDINSSDISVIKRDALPRVVKEIDERIGLCLDEEQINRIYDELYPFTQVDGDVKEAHIENIETKYKSFEEPAENTANKSELIGESVRENVCPKCGGELVLRTAKKGKNAGNKFYGCSNYPKCRYVKTFSEK